jgi:hypothetical protein
MATSHEYSGELITFDFVGDDKLINATQMAKAFPKRRMSDFLKAANTKAFIAALKARYAAEDGRQVLHVVKGGTPEAQGTWMDELLAIKFAGWLSPEFEIWMYERVRELLTTGQTAIQGVPQQGTIIQGLRAIVSQLEAQEVFNEDIRRDVDDITARMQEVEAKITSTDENYYTIAGYCTLHRISCPLAKATGWGKEAAALSRKKGYEMGTAHDVRFGKVRTYHKDILKAVLQ